MIGLGAYLQQWDGIGAYWDAAIERLRETMNTNITIEVPERLKVELDRHMVDEAEALDAVAAMVETRRLIADAEKRRSDFALNETHEEMAIKRLGAQLRENIERIAAIGKDWDGLVPAREST